jgi:glycosyltransferase involved in cell wall biosynthesis
MRDDPSVISAPHPQLDQLGLAHRADGDGSFEVSVVIPCLNEARTVGICVQKALRAFDEMGLPGEVLVVDNGSTDGSQEVAARAGARVVRTDRRGYGAALIHGCENVRGRYIVMGDADDSYDFLQLAPFVEKLRAGFDLVMGTRLKGKILPGAMPWRNRYIGNPALSGMLRVLFGASVSDAHCGLRGFTRDAFQQMRLRTPGMEFASEMVIKATKLKLRITEVPITFYPDGRRRPPHLRPWRDGWRHVKLMLMFSPPMLFLIPGVGLILMGLILMATQLFAPPNQPFWLLGFRLDFHWAIVGSLMVLVGYQIVTTHFFARAYSVAHHVREDDTLIIRAFRVVTLGRAVTAAVVVILAGAIIDAAVAFRWVINDLGPLSSASTRQLIFGSTLIALGVQTFFSAFFFSLLGDAWRFERPEVIPQMEMQA